MQPDDFEEHEIGCPTSQFQKELLQGLQTMTTWAKTNQYAIKHGFPIKVDRVDNGKTKKAPFWKLANLPANSIDKDNFYHASLSKEHNNHHAVSSTGSVHISSIHKLIKFSLNDLKIVTKDFSHDMKLGEGRIGEVFVGEYVGRSFKQFTSSQVACDGIYRIAIKRFHRDKIPHLIIENGDRKCIDLTFLSKLIKHPNHVKVLGYCFEDEKIFLIYEFMENGSLDSHLFTKDKIPLTWKTRVQIAIGIAEALLFLQKTHIQPDNFSIKIHQILLDKNFNPKISDFESAKLVHGDSSNDTEQSNKSEYEGMVRSFGVLLIQIITGERASDNDITNLRKNMWNPEREYRNESLRKAMDPRLTNVDDPSIMEAMKVALDSVAITSFSLFGGKRFQDFDNQFLRVKKN